MGFIPGPQIIPADAAANVSSMRKLELTATGAMPGNTVIPTWSIWETLQDLDLAAEATVTLPGSSDAPIILGGKTWLVKSPANDRVGMVITNGSGLRIRPRDSLAKDTSPGIIFWAEYASAVDWDPSTPIRALMYVSSKAGNASIKAFLNIDIYGSPSGFIGSGTGLSTDSVYSVETTPTATMVHQSLIADKNVAGIDMPLGVFQLSTNHVCKTYSGNLSFSDTQIVNANTGLRGNYYIGTATPVQFNLSVRVGGWGGENTGNNGDFVISRILFQRLKRI